MSLKSWADKIWGSENHCLHSFPKLSSSSHNHGHHTSAYCPLFQKGFPLGKLTELAPGTSGQRPALPLTLSLILSNPLLKSHCSLSSTLLSLVPIINHEEGGESLKDAEDGSLPPFLLVCEVDALHVKHLGSSSCVSHLRSAKYFLRGWHSSLSPRRHFHPVAKHMSPGAASTEALDSGSWGVRSLRTHNGSGPLAPPGSEHLWLNTAISSSLGSSCSQFSTLEFHSSH